MITAFWIFLYLFIGIASQRLFFYYYPDDKAEEKIGDRTVYAFLWPVVLILAIVIFFFDLCIRCPWVYLLTGRWPNDGLWQDDKR